MGISAVAKLSTTTLTVEGLTEVITASEFEHEA